MNLESLASSPRIPSGMLSTPAGRLLPDDGHGRLVQLLDEAYEIHNDHVVVAITGRDPFQLFLGDHVAADGSVRLADDLVVLPGGTISDPEVDGLGVLENDGAVAWCGGHTIGDRRTTRFRIDGRAARIEIVDPLAVPRKARS